MEELMQERPQGEGRKKIEGLLAGGFLSDIGMDGENKVSGMEIEERPGNKEVEVMTQPIKPDQIIAMAAEIMIREIEDEIQRLRGKKITRDHYEHQQKLAALSKERRELSENPGAKLSIEEAKSIILKDDPNAVFEIDDIA